MERGCSQMETKATDCCYLKTWRPDIDIFQSHLETSKFATVYISVGRSICISYFAISWFMTSMEQASRNGCAPITSLILLVMSIHLLYNEIKPRGFCINFMIMNIEAPILGGFVLALSKNFKPSNAKELGINTSIVTGFEWSFSYTMNRHFWSKGQRSSRKDLPSTV